MSGGSFDHAYQSVERFADELELKISHNVDYKFPEEVIQILKEVQKSAELIAKLMKEVEWLYSGDTGPESFMKRIGKKK